MAQLRVAGIARMFVCISTRNRDAFYTWTRQQVAAQTLQPVRVVIVDGSDKPGIWSSWPDAIYIHRPACLLGESRNLAIAAARAAGAETIALWDDDDWYAPWRLEKAQALLDANSDIDVIGSTITPIVFTDTQEVIICGPYHATHALEPTLVFRAGYTGRFQADDPMGLGRPFLRNYTVPLLQMPDAHILIAHGTNTYSKEQVRQNPAKYSGRVAAEFAVPAEIQCYVS
jgi:glycosyltransferase involved in cell wall biosynthesis